MVSNNDMYMWKVSINERKILLPLSAWIVVYEGESRASISDLDGPDGQDEMDDRDRTASWIKESRSLCE